AARRKSFAAPSNRCRSMYSAAASGFAPAPATRKVAAAGKRATSRPSAPIATLTIFDRHRGTDRREEETMKLRNLLLTSLLAVAAMPARAIVPETGLYWMPDYSGTAVYVEHQNGTVAVTVYAFDPETGQAEIYTSAGPLRDDGTGWFLGQVPSPLPPMEGWLPSHWYQGDLYQATHGQPLTGLQLGYSGQSEKVGTITLGF